MPSWLPETWPGTVCWSTVDPNRMIGLIKQSADEGTQQGDSADLPPIPHWPDSWQLGQPDLVISLPKA